MSSMETTKNIQQVIEEQIRPALQGHGGDIEFLGVDLEAGVVTVRLVGACGSCPFAQETLRMQVEEVLKHAIPEIRQVVRG